MKTLKLLFAALAAVTMTFTAQAAKTAKAVVEEGGTTLRFVYDETDYGTKGTKWFSVAEAEAIDPYDDVPWCGCGETVTKVVFDSSFAAYRPKQCGSWFRDFGVLAAVEGLTNLNTSVATNMAYMFYGCSSLTTLDVSGFDTANVTDMGYMFAFCSSLKTLDVLGFDTANVTDMGYMFCGCSSLEAICASDQFVTDRVSDSSSMFQSCSKLVGGAGTKYNSDETDKTYARIDGKDGQHGYFTRGAVYTVAFVGNGATSGSMPSHKYGLGKVYNLPKCAFKKKGKAFKGWAGDNERRYDDGILIFNAAAEGKVLTLTAVWE